MKEITVSFCRIQYPYIESVRDQGFGQSDIRRNFIKNENTWYRMLAHYDAK